jgi:predicted transcriptional regulator
MMQKRVEIKNKYTQHNIARILNISQGNVSYIFRGTGEFKDEHYEKLISVFPEIKLIDNDIQKIKEYLRLKAKEVRRDFIRNDKRK